MTPDDIRGALSMLRGAFPADRVAPSEQMAATWWEALQSFDTNVVGEVVRMWTHQGTGFPSLPEFAAACQRCERRRDDQAETVMLPIGVAVRAVMDDRARAELAVSRDYLAMIGEHRRCLVGDCRTCAGRPERQLWLADQLRQIRRAS